MDLICDSIVNRPVDKETNASGVQQALKTLFNYHLKSGNS